MIFHCHIATHSDRGMLAFANISGDPFISDEFQLTNFPVPTLDYPNCVAIVPEPEDEPEDGIHHTYPPIPKKPKSEKDKLLSMLPYGLSLLLVVAGLAVVGFFIYQRKAETVLSHTRENFEILSSSDEEEHKIWLSRHNAQNKNPLAYYRPSIDYNTL